MRSVLCYLESFRIDDNRKYDFIKKVAEAYFQEHGGSNTLKAQLNQKFKANKQRIETHMDQNNDKETGLDDVQELLDSRSEANFYFVNTVLSKINADADNNIQHRYLSDLNHMAINRIFIGQGRKYEFVVYFFLERFFFSQLMRKTKLKQ